MCACVCVFVCVLCPLSTIYCILEAPHSYGISLVGAILSFLALLFHNIRKYVGAYSEVVWRFMYVCNLRTLLGLFGGGWYTVACRSVCSYV